MLAKQLQKSLEPIVTLGGLVGGGYSLQTHTLFVLMTIVLVITVLSVIAKLRGGTNLEVWSIASDVILGVLYTMSVFLAGLEFVYFGSAIKRAFFGAQ